MALLDWSTLLELTASVEVNSITELLDSRVLLELKISFENNI